MLILGKVTLSNCNSYVKMLLTSVVNFGVMHDNAEELTMEQGYYKKR